VDMPDGGVENLWITLLKPSPLSVRDPGKAGLTCKLLRLLVERVWINHVRDRLEGLTDPLATRLRLTQTWRRCYQQNASARCGGKTAAFTATLTSRCTGTPPLIRFRRPIVAKALGPRKVPLRKDYLI
jgi:hypothetical protein